MKRKLLGCLAAIALGAATPAMAFHGGGFGGMHGGFGGMHGGFGGMHASAFHGGMVGGPAFAGPRTNAFVNNRFVGNRFVGANRFAFAHNRFAFAHNRFFFRHRHFRNAFFAAPFVAYAGAYGYDDYCWRRVWTYYGWRWANVCYGY